MNIAQLIHPIYENQIEDWYKWRLAYEGGPRFIAQYTQRFSKREDDNDFIERKRVTYCPRFAGSAIDEIKNSIFQRFIDITRTGGTPSYQQVVNGGMYGVDLLGNSMNSFIGNQILPDLLVMGKVGIYVDMPKVENLYPTLAGFGTNRTIRPYLYIYHVEDIRNWYQDDSPNPNHFSSIILRENKYLFDPDTHLPIDTIEIYKHFWIEDGTVWVQIYNEESNPIDDSGNELNDVLPVNINLPRIPFILSTLSHSLMTDIADYQIALLNLASSDMGYSLKSNFPFYVEQTDFRMNSPYLKSNQDDIDPQGNKTIDTGPGTGRQYPMGANEPSFIHPSPDPLLASIKKQEQLKEEIRLLLNLSITNLSPHISSAESKGFDERTLESGLSYIGLELEHVERQIGEIWSMYEGKFQDAPTIKYPEKYNLKSDDDRRKDCQEYSKLLPIIPSKIYQKEVAKIISDILLRSKVPDDILIAIKKEIDRANVIYIDPQTISTDVEHGLVSLETASIARGYPKGEVEQAKQDHADRLARIAISQSQGAAAELNGNANQGNGNSNSKQSDNNPLDKSGSRGVPDLSNNPKLDAQREKAISRDTTTDTTPTDHTRGKGK